MHAFFFYVRLATINRAPSAAPSGQARCRRQSHEYVAVHFIAIHAVSEVNLPNSCDRDRSCVDPHSQFSSRVHELCCENYRPLFFFCTLLSRATCTT